MSINFPMSSSSHCHIVVPNNLVEEDIQFIVAVLVIFLSLLKYIALTIGIIWSNHLVHSR